MRVLRSSLGPAENVAHAVTVLPDVPGRDPCDIVTVAGSVIAKTRLRFSSLGARRRLLREHVVRFLTFLSSVLTLALPLGLLLFLRDIILRGDPLTFLFIDRRFDASLVWLGTCAGTFLTYLKGIPEGPHSPLQLRPIGEELPALPEDVAAHLRAIRASCRLADIGRAPDAAGERLLAAALLSAARRGETCLRPAHVVRCAIDTADGVQFLRRAGIAHDDLLRRLDRILPIRPRRGIPAWDEESYLLLHAAFLEAFRERRNGIGVMELLLAALARDAAVRDVFLDLSVTLADARAIAVWVRFASSVRGSLSSLRRLAGFKPVGPMNMAMTARLTPHLDRICTDLTARAAAGKIGPLLGRDAVVAEIFRILRGDLGNVLLVGDPGCGKSEILQGIAQLMAAEDVPKNLQDRRFLLLDPASLIAGAHGTGEIEGRLKDVVGEIMKAGNVLLGIEDIHHLLGAASTRSSGDAGSLLMNALSEGKLRVIATTTAQEFAAFIQPHAAFLRRFQIVRIPEMGREETIRVLEAAALPLEDREGVRVSYGALVAVYELCARLLPDRHFPDKALRVLEQSCAQAAARGKGTTVTREDVARVMESRTSVAVTAVSGAEAGGLLDLENALHRRIVGQEDALAAIGSALRRARTGLRRTDRPIATLLFLGPTGVGKTETAKAIADLSFGGTERLIRLDLSEYQTRDSLEKLLGRAGASSPFLDAVRRYPAHLLLLDEFEKAHAGVLNVFLQLFEDGRLTDGRGKAVHFHHALIIATSNMGSQRMQQGLREGKHFADIQKEILREDVLARIAPELLNRFDRVVFFRPLTADHMRPIVSLQLKPLASALERQGIGLEVLPGALDDLARRGYDPLSGARGLRRLLQDTVEDEVAKLLLQGRVKRRDALIIGEGGALAVRQAEALA